MEEGTKGDKAHGRRREGTGLPKPRESATSLTKGALDRAGSFPSHLVLKAVGCGPGSLHSGLGGPQAQGPLCRQKLMWAQPLLVVGLHSVLECRYTCLAAASLWIGAP